jgi:hypothetical protein
MRLHEAEYTGTIGQKLTGLLTGRLKKQVNVLPICIHIPLLRLQGERITYRISSLGSEGLPVNRVSTEPSQNYRYSRCLST